MSLLGEESSECCFKLLGQQKWLLSSWGNLCASTSADVIISNTEEFVFLSGRRSPIRASRLIAYNSTPAQPLQIKFSLKIPTKIGASWGRCPNDRGKSDTLLQILSRICAGKKHFYHFHCEDLLRGPPSSSKCIHKWSGWISSPLKVTHFKQSSVN